MQCPDYSEPRSVITILIVTEDPPRLIAFFKNGFDLHTNYHDPSISTTQHGTTIDTVFMRGLYHLKSQIDVSYLSYHKPILTYLSL